MQIVIPMSGTGRRFLEAGYRVPKPLIEVDGKPVIEHVVNMFPGETKFTFICNTDHLRDTDMREVLKRIAPAGRIVGIGPHKKGPVYAVSQAFDGIDNGEETIVNYCDFSCYWDYADFLKHTRNRKADGAIPAYRGFHPHMLGTTNYAFMKDENQWMLEIREKEPFTGNRMNEFASSGTYYFRTGEFVKRYFTRLMERNIHLNGEYYVSMVYNLLKEDRLKVSIYEIQHMLQWGTPRDLEDYRKWSSYFSEIIRPRERTLPKKNSVLVIPLAGRGQRFVNEHYEQPKPLIEVGGKPMIVQAADSLLETEKQTFLCLKGHLDNYPLEDELRKRFPDARIVSIDRVTEGQACTAEIGVRDEEPGSSLLIGACDNGILWNPKRYAEIAGDPETDVIVFSFRRQVSAERHPQMYGWLKTDASGRVTEVSVKKPVSGDPYNDHAITGAFYFKRADIYLKSYSSLVSRDVRVNNEFYIDSLVGESIRLGYRVKVFEADHYVCWGTPDDLRTYEYWQSYFHKAAGHPYRLEKDRTVNPDRIPALDAKYRRFSQASA